MRSSGMHLAIKFMFKLIFCAKIAHWEVYLKQNVNFGQCERPVPQNLIKLFLLLSIKFF